MTSLGSSLHLDTGHSFKPEQKISPALPKDQPLLRRKKKNSGYWRRPEAELFAAKLKASAGSITGLVL